MKVKDFVKLGNGMLYKVIDATHDGFRQDGKLLLWGNKSDVLEEGYGEYEVVEYAPCTDIGRTMLLYVK